MPLNDLDQLQYSFNASIEGSKNIEMNISDRLYYQFLEKNLKNVDIIIKEKGFCPLPYNRNEVVYIDKYKERWWNERAPNKKETLRIYQQYLNPRKIEKFFDAFVYEQDLENLRTIGYPLPNHVQEEFLRKPIPRKFYFEENVEKDEKLEYEKNLFPRTNKPQFSISGITVGELINYYKKFLPTDSCIMAKVLIMLREGILNISDAYEGVLEIEAFQRTHKITYQQILNIFK